MIDVKFILPFVLVALLAYVVDGARRVEDFKKRHTPATKAEFLADKLRRQVMAILLIPGLGLLVTQTFHAAVHPGTRSTLLATQLSAVTGYSGARLWSLLSLETVGQVVVAILVLELIAMARGSKSQITLGDVSALLPRRPSEFALCACLAVVAGVGEELLFRGFIPLGLEAFGASFPLALLVSVIIFGACHLYQGPIGVLATGVAGAFLTAAYVLTDSLVFVIVVHVAVDIAGLVLRPLTAIGLRRIVERARNPRQDRLMRP
jgi:membrane protease YdiL (CAAX protease family)